MKNLTVAAALVLTLAAAGCSDDSEGDSDTAAPAPAASSSEPAAESAAPSEAAAGGGDNVLTGTVGTEEDPDAFEITLTDESGAPVSELPAGDYTIEVNDPSAIHNFHLTGGSVDETTSVPGVEQTEFEVTLEPGDYTYTCDPHPPMTGEFTVT